MATPALEQTAQRREFDETQPSTADRATRGRIYTTTYSGRTEVDVDKLLEQQQDFMAEVSSIIERVLSKEKPVRK